MSADWVLEQMRYARNRLNIVIPDACRNNPFTRSMRSAGSGLAKMDAPAGTLIAYSTAPGDVAADGTGRNSPFTLRPSRGPCAKVRQPAEQVFKRARVSVRSATAEKQTPWSHLRLPEISILSRRRCRTGPDGSAGFRTGSATAGCCDPSGTCRSERFERPR